MEKLIIILVSIGLLILDNSLVPFFSIKGAYPSLLFVFAIAYSIINGKEKAIFIGVVSGMLTRYFLFSWIWSKFFTEFIIMSFSKFYWRRNSKK